MLSRNEAHAALRRLFRRRPVVDLDGIFRVLGTNCRTSVFRRLRELGYQTSFSHSGRYYTLTEIPRFDANGLWFHQSIGFARARTLKATVADLIERSQAGHTFGELVRLTGVRVDSTLTTLVSEGTIRRRRVARRSVYVSQEEAAAARQMKERGAQSARSRADSLAAPLVVEVLLEVVRTSEVYVDPDVVATRLGARGVVVSAAQVLAVYESYGLEPGKKTATVRPQSSSGR